ncbi:MAG: hypothetical protein H0X29_01010 [Parachlamydiaceae bacterium]|nr:hypothetical protein [Parachlamydiaceae bacterium]
MNPLPDKSLSMAELEFIARNCLSPTLGGKSLQGESNKKIWGALTQSWSEIKDARVKRQEYEARGGIWYNNKKICELIINKIEQYNKNEKWDSELISNISADSAHIIAILNLLKQSGAKNKLVKKIDKLIINLQKNVLINKQEIEKKFNKKITSPNLFTKTIIDIHSFNNPTQKTSETVEKIVSPQIVSKQSEQPKTEILATVENLSLPKQELKHGKRKLPEKTHQEAVGEHQSEPATTEKPLESEEAKNLLVAKKGTAKIKRKRKEDSKKLKGIRSDQLREQFQSQPKQISGHKKLDSQTIKKAKKTEMDELQPQAAKKPKLGAPIDAEKPKVPPLSLVETAFQVSEAAVVEKQSEMPSVIKKAEKPDESPSSQNVNFGSRASNWTERRSSRGPNLIKIATFALAFLLPNLVGPRPEEVNLLRKSTSSDFEFSELSGSDNLVVLPKETFPKQGENSIPMSSPYFDISPPSTALVNVGEVISSKQEKGDSILYAESYEELPEILDLDTGPSKVPLSEIGKLNQSDNIPLSVSGKGALPPRNPLAIALKHNWGWIAMKNQVLTLTLPPPETFPCDPESMQVSEVENPKKLIDLSKSQSGQLTIDSNYLLGRPPEIAISTGEKFNKKIKDFEEPMIISSQVSSYLQKPLVGRKTSESYEKEIIDRGQPEEFEEEGTIDLGELQFIRPVQTDLTIAEKKSKQTVDELLEPFPSSQSINTSALGAPSPSSATSDTIPKDVLVGEKTTQPGSKPSTTLEDTATIPQETGGMRIMLFAVVATCASIAAAILRNNAAEIFRKSKMQKIKTQIEAQKATPLALPIPILNSSNSVKRKKIEKLRKPPSLTEADIKKGGVGVGTINLDLAKSTRIGPKLVFADTLEFYKEYAPHLIGTDSNNMPMLTFIDGKPIKLIRGDFLVPIVISQKNSENIQVLLPSYLLSARKEGETLDLKLNGKNFRFRISPKEPQESKAKGFISFSQKIKIYEEQIYKQGYAMSPEILPKKSRANELTLYQANKDIPRYTPPSRVIEKMKYSKDDVIKTTIKASEVEYVNEKANDLKEVLDLVMDSSLDRYDVEYADSRLRIPLTRLNYYEWIETLPKLSVLVMGSNLSEDAGWYPGKDVEGNDQIKVPIFGSTARISVMHDYLLVTWERVENAEMEGSKLVASNPKLGHHRVFGQHMAFISLKEFNLTAQDLDKNMDQISVKEGILSIPIQKSRPKNLQKLEEDNFSERELAT